MRPLSIIIFFAVTMFSVLGLADPLEDAVRAGQLWIIKELVKESPDAEMKEWNRVLRLAKEFHGEQSGFFGAVREKMNKRERKLNRIEGLNIVAQEVHVRDIDGVDEATECQLLEQLRRTGITVAAVFGSGQATVDFVAPTGNNNFRRGSSRPNDRETMEVVGLTGNIDVAPGTKTFRATGATDVNEVAEIVRRAGNRNVQFAGAKDVTIKSEGPLERVEFVGLDLRGGSQGRARQRAPAPENGMAEPNGLALDRRRVNEARELFALLRQHNAPFLETPLGQDYQDRLTRYTARLEVGTELAASSRKNLHILAKELRKLKQAMRL
jgi:hypothetical protein